MWRLMSHYVIIFYYSKLFWCYSNFQIYSIKLVIIPSRDIWTWTHHHPSVELDFAVDQHENSLHDCLTVSSPTQGHWGLAVASYRWGRRGSCSPPSTEVEFHERNGALPSQPLFWTCQNCGFLLEKRLLILLIFSLCFHPFDFSTCQRGLDIWLHDAWKTYESTNVRNTLAPLPSPAIPISRYAQLPCSSSESESAESIKRGFLIPSSEGFPWQWPYILWCGEKKPLFCEDSGYWRWSFAPGNLCMKCCEHLVLGHHDFVKTSKAVPLEVLDLL